MNSTDASEMKLSKKRANGNIATSSGVIVSKRAKHLSLNIASFYKMFPEMNYIVDLRQIQKHVKGAVKKLVEAKEAKRRKKELIPLNSMPDEVLQNCMSYLGGGQYGLVALASKKLFMAYTSAYGQETSYLEMATSIKLVNHCIKDLCRSSKEKDELFKAAAVNGDIDILRAAVKEGYNMSSLIEMNKHTIYAYADGSFSDECEIIEEEEEDEDESEENTAEYYYTEDGVVKLSHVVSRGHLHVLKYLYDELNYKGLHRYVKPAIQYGQLGILEWLKNIGCMDSNHEIFAFYYEPYQGSDFSDFSHYGYLHYSFCNYAVKFGNVRVLQWLMSQGHDFADWYFGPSFPVMYYAISSESLDMIRFCSEKGYYINDDQCEDALKETGNIEVYRLLHDLGFDFRKGMSFFLGSRFRDRNAAQDFEIIKFLRSISVPWDKQIMKDIVQHYTVEMIQYAHEDGCPWTSCGDEYKSLFRYLNWDLEKLKFLVSHGCTFDFEHVTNGIEQSLLDLLRSKKEHALLHFFIGKNSRFDNKLFKCFLRDHSRGELWFEGFSYLFENGSDIENVYGPVEDASQILSLYEKSSDWSKQRLFDFLQSKKDLSILDTFVGKNSSFDFELLQYFQEISEQKWDEGISYLREMANKTL